MSGQEAGMDPATTPGMPPPPGEESHFGGPYSALQVGICISFGVTYFFAAFFLGLRYFQAFKLIKKIELDLVITTLAFAGSLVYFITVVHMMENGWGRHLWDVSLANLAQFNEGLLPNTMTYLIIPSVTKLGMLATLYRIDPRLGYRCAVIAVAVAIFAYTITLCTITGVPCNPTKAGTTKCLENVALAHGSLNIASDFAVIIIPIPTIHSLQLSLKQRISIGCLLTVGSGVVICSIARIPYVLSLDAADDITYTEGILGVWSIVEINLGLCCACAMRLKSLIKAYLPQLGIFSSRSGATGSNSWADQLQRDKSNGPRSYQLHSVQKGSAAGRVDYYGETQLSSKRDDNGSTDQILD